MFIRVNVIRVIGVAQGCCQLVWHSSTEEQGRQFTLNTAAVHWCLVTAHMYAEWMFIGVNVTGVNKQWHKAAVSWFGTAAQKTKAGS